jgi:hypothetical protein
MEYVKSDGEVKKIGDFGRSTQREFDEALASLPSLIGQSRDGNLQAGATANALLWKLANEATNTFKTTQDFECIYPFGRETSY